MKRNIYLTLVLLTLAGFSMNLAEAKQEEPVSLKEKVFTAEEMQEIADYADPQILSAVSHKLGSATSYEYVSAYLESDPDFANILMEKFNVKVN